MIAQLDKRLADKRISVKVTDDAMTAVIDRGFDPAFGARPLRRYIQQHIETLIAKNILAGAVEMDSVVTVDLDKDGNFAIKNCLKKEE